MASRIKDLVGDILQAMKPTEFVREHIWQEELYELLDELDHRREMAVRYPHINDLIAHINELYWILGGEMETIQPERTP